MASMYKCVEGSSSLTVALLVKIELNVQLCSDKIARKYVSFIKRKVIVVDIFFCNENDVLVNNFNPILFTR